MGNVSTWEGSRMPETIDCRFCGEKVGTDSAHCNHCGSELKIASNATAFQSEDESVSSAVSGEDEFSELDYRPKKKIGCLVPALVILLALFMIFVGVMVYRSFSSDPLAEEDDIEMPDQVQPVEVPSGSDPDGEEPEPEPDPEPVETTPVAGPKPPDYDQLEVALEGWLVNRIYDPDAILLHTKELEDVEQFFESYDLADDTIIVYQVESTYEEFATVVFGLPFSQWTIKAVFIWRDNNWEFLREETID